MESLTQSNDFTAAVAATRQYWGSEHEHNDAELFARARCQWEDAKGEDTATREFVLQVVACRLEEQLLLWLLQFHASDAAERMQTLFEVCSDSYFTAEGLELLSPVLDTLLTAAVSRAAACDRSAENRKRRIAEMVEKVNSSALMSSEVRSVVRALVVANEDGGAWKQFLDLPSELETRLFNSRSGRAFLDEVQQVVTLQQVEMNAAFGECERCDSLETEMQMPTADVLWTLAEKLVEMVTAQAETEKDAQTLSSAGFDTTGTSLVVENVTDLEEYLEAKESVTATGLVVQEVMASRDDENLSAIEQLSETYSSLNGEPVISSGLLEKVFDEMSAVTNLDILSSLSAGLGEPSIALQAKCEIWIMLRR
ncbi:hypothetical protein PF005_g6187 [Phytophthora fragariae]|uniref:Uncharacterized protein n=1 Tax=Phytophthora fragariae TaxID=53985 RepID=A0A6A3YUU3_9STRA|nr:hypothetical protein PF011_g16279 [Phytophthora fragariae]KAE9117396.1 hypothetical protein PF010_g8621 [Phytophthora fragariae]KAE9124821.1 hypothetical protein PF007_g6584 [Phytophthora fragariae]KAE9223771.1 hypothetical protein PF005_g6187 [Phytophthora fragariae]KAE9238590.1 hypothetical protein PF004_g8276 [Phytophthora fragariae]